MDRSVRIIDIVNKLVEVVMGKPYITENRVPLGSKSS